MDVLMTSGEKRQAVRMKAKITTKAFYSIFSPLISDVLNSLSGQLQIDLHSISQMYLSVLTWGLE